MDRIAQLLEGTRARGAFALRCVMRPPWGLRVVAESPATVLAPVRGPLWVTPDGGAPIQVEAGGVAVTRGPNHYNVTSAQDTAPDIVIHKGQECRDLEGNSLLDQLMHDVRTWGNDPAGESLFLVGAYEHLSIVSDGLRQIVPPVLALSPQEFDSPIIALLNEEAAKDEPGQAAVLDRLLDLLLTSALKAWAGRQDPGRPEWWRTQGDSVVGRAVQLMHEDPGRSWTLDKLASEVCASRASLARRFHDIVGEPPMTFLKNWRMALAADLLSQPDETVGTVAEKVGYSSPFAFSAAFKRMRGLSPHEHRALARAGPG